MVIAFGTERWKVGEVGMEIHELKELKNISVDYDSPIHIITEMSERIAKFTDDGVMKAVFKAGFDIDKEKLTRIIEQDKERYCDAYRRGYMDGYDSRENEIVRCMDCRYWLPMNRFQEDYQPGNGECELNCWIRQMDWFCADGRRKDDETDVR